MTTIYGNIQVPNIQIDTDEIPEKSKKSTVKKSAKKVSKHKLLTDLKNKAIDVDVNDFEITDEEEIAESSSDHESENMDANDEDFLVACEASLSPERKRVNKTGLATPKKKKLKTASFKTPKKSDTDGITSRKRLVKTPKPTKYNLRNVQAIENDSSGESGNSSIESESGNSEEETESKDAAELGKVELMDDKENDHLTNDAYFMAHHKIVKTSGNTLAQLGHEIDPHEISRQTQLPNEVCKKRYESFKNKNTANFREMMYWLSQDFSVLCYGFGSKHSLLREFKNNYLTDYPVLEVTAFNTQQRLSGKGLLDNLLVELLGVANSIPRSTFEQMKILNDYFSDDRPNPKNVEWEEVFILVHNIEFLPNFKSPQDSYLCILNGCHNTLGVLAKLATYPRIHIMCSVDNVNSGIAFNSQSLAAFKFVNFLVRNPLSEYSLELRAQGYGLEYKEDEVMLSAIMNIYKSLTQNAQKIFQILVNYQIDNTEAMDVEDLYNKCRRGFLVTSMLTLKQQLVEFCDHKLLSIKRKDGKSEQLFLHINPDTLLNLKSEF